MAESPSELQFEIEKLERKHAENPEGRFFVPLANAYRKMGDVETAEALLRSGVERHPDYLSAHIVLGRCLADRGAVREAEEEFRFVLSQDPQNLIALRTLGELAVAGGRPAEAADWYRELLAVDPMNEDARQAIDSLSDAPASADEESEFRSGAGWWDAGADAAEEAPGSDSSAAAPESAGSLDEAAPGAGADGEWGVTEREVPTGADDDQSPVDSMAAWAGYDDLPGLRADAPPTAGWESDANVDADSMAGWERLADDDSHGRDGDEAPETEGPTSAPEPFIASFAEQTSSASDARTERADEDRYQAGESSEVVTETIAELYARQGLHERAAVVYRELIRRRGGDAALERRLAEIELMGREETEEEETDTLTLADEEALPSPPLDVQNDAFAASFESGFSTVEPEEESAAEEQPQPLEAAAAGVERREGGSIVNYLSGLVRWRPAGTAATSAEVPAAPWESGAEETGPRTVDDEMRPGEASSPEAWEDNATSAGSDERDPWEFPASDASAGLQAAPWETMGADDSEELPYLEGIVDSAADAGTGSAEDEPFPWELPGRERQEEPSGSAEAPPVALDPFFVDDVEPLLPAGDDSLPEAAPQLPEARQPPRPPAEADPSEDEDLESFQAWLRSLKR